MSQWPLLPFSRGKSLLVGSTIAQDNLASDYPRGCRPKSNLPLCSWLKNSGVTSLEPLPKCIFELRLKSWEKISIASPQKSRGSRKSALIASGSAPPKLTFPLLSPCLIMILVDSAPESQRREVSAVPLACVGLGSVHKKFGPLK